MNTPPPTADEIEAKIDETILRMRASVRIIADRDCLVPNIVALASESLTRQAAELDRLLQKVGR